MNNIQLILKNVLPGDILLTRSKRDPVIYKTSNDVCGYWREAFLCLENKQVLVCCSGLCGVLPMSLTLTNECDFGLFRVKKDMDLNKFDLICKSILDSMKWEYNGFHFTLGQHQMICIGYDGIGVNLTDRPYWKTIPSYFDISSKTIRIV